VETESTELRKRWGRALDSLRESLRVKRRTLEFCREQGRWTADGYFSVRAKALAGDDGNNPAIHGRRRDRERKRDRTNTTAADSPKTDTKQASYALYRAGKSLEEIANARSLTVSTIQGHMIPYIANGEVPLSAFVPDEKAEKIRAALAAASASAAPGNAGGAGGADVSIKDVKTSLGADFSYAEINLVRAAP
jgi:hypothetical protein